MRHCMHYLKLTILIAATLPLCVQSANADNWAHWRGPTGNGTAPGATPPTTWSDTENVKWKVAIPGAGSGSPVIWENQVFVVTAVKVAGAAASGAGQAEAGAAGGRQQAGGRRRGGFLGGRGGGEALSKHRFEVHCYDRDTGALVWKQVATESVPHEGTHSTNGFASASPCTDGEYLYVSFGSRGVYCYTLAGELVWQRNDFEKMRARNGFGEGSSPTLAGDKLILPWDHEGQSYLYALDKKSGATIWQTKRDEPTCWATPLIIEHQGQSQIVMNGQTCARGYDLATGAELWRCGGQTDRPAASAVAADGLVFVGSGFRGSFMGAFRPDGRGDIEGSEHVSWTLDRDTPDIPSPLLSKGRLYFFKGKSGILTCVDAATGKPHYAAERIRDLDMIYASPVEANGFVYLTDRNGTTVVIKDANALDVVAINSVGETVDATPAPVDNQLFIRGERHLFCIAAE